MRFRLAVRVLLAVVAASGVVAIGWSLFSRGDGGKPLSDGLLGPGIARESTDFEHVEYKRGQAVFRVRSKVDTLTEVGQHLLQDVRLTVYGREGAATDWIEGRNATYLVQQKRIEFRDQVEAGLSDGTLLFSDRLDANLESETVSIEKDFRFQRGEVLGRGRDLLYEIATKSLRIGAEFRMDNPDKESPFSVTADRGRYDLAAARLDLEGAARLTGRDYLLSGDRMRVQLTPEGRVESIDDSDNAKFVSGEKSFAGGQILLRFDVASARLRGFEVVKKPGATAASRAVFLQGAPRSAHRLEADRIFGVPNPKATDAGRFQLETFRAEGQPVFVSPELGVDRAASGLLVGAFDGGGSLRQLDMTDGVMVDRTLDDRRDRLKSRRLSLVFDQTQRLQRGAASSNVEITITEPGRVRTLTARDSVLMDFREGLVSRITASGGCRLETVEGPARSEVLAPSMLALFSDGVVDRISAGDGVRVEMREGEARQRTESLRLRLVYQEGKLRRAIHTGDFRYVDDSPGRQLRLAADEAVFDPSDDRIVAVGRDPRPKLVQASTDPSAAASSASETEADRFQIERDSGKVLAEGNVSSRLSESERPFWITSGQMSADSESGVVVYSQSPLLREGESRISGTLMTLRGRDQSLLVEGAVDSFLSSGEGDKLTTYRVSSQRARILRAENRALYEGDVQARAEKEEMSLKAPFLELRFGAEGFGELREALAWGGVRIQDPTRQSVGERAFYEPLEKKVRVLGDKAEVVDSKQGRATGAELIFFLGDERILIEGPVKRQP